MLRNLRVSEPRGSLFRRKRFGRKSEKTGTAISQD